MIGLSTAVDEGMAKTGKTQGEVVTFIESKYKALPKETRAAYEARAKGVETGSTGFLLWLKEAGAKQD